MLPNRAEVDSGEYQRQLGRAHFDRHDIRCDYRKLERAGGFESFVPDHQAVAIPVEDLEAVATPIDEQEKVAGGWILRKGGCNQAGESIKAFAKISWR